MRNSTEETMIDVWFNNKLFYVNGKRLKFYLEGFSTVESCSVIKIIEAYGGELSKPTEDTIVFSEPGRSIASPACYNLKYFRDCIIANQLLTLKQYKLTSAASHRNLSHHDAGHKTKRRNSTEDSLLDEIKDERTDEDSSTSARTRPFRFKDKKEGMFAERMDEGRGAKKLRQCNVVLNKVFEVQSNFGERSNEESGSSDNNSSLGTSIQRGRIPFTEEENRRIIEYLVEKNAVSRGCGISIWKEMLKDNRMVHRAPSRLVRHFRDYLRFNYAKYTDDVNARKEFERLPEEARKYSSKYFSKDEDRQIIQYLIDKEAIPRAQCITVWNEMVKDCGITNKTAYSLMTYFNNVLKFEYKHYTEDVEACREFEELRYCKKRKRSKRRIFRPRWTVADNRAMIDYLVDNDLLREAGRKTTWEKFVKTVKLENERTPGGLAMHFVTHLRTEYARYTNDPEALNKFAAIEKRRKRSRNFFNRN